MPFAKRGDVVHSEATSGFNNQKKSLLINGLAALGDSLHPLHSTFLPLSAGPPLSQTGSAKTRQCTQLQAACKIARLARHWICE